MESAKQEKKNLMQDMPIDDKGSAMMKKGCSAANYGSPMKMGGSWMSKHCQSAINYGSPLNKGKKVTVTTQDGKKVEVDSRSPEAAHARRYGGGRQDSHLDDQ